MVFWFLKSEDVFKPLSITVRTVATEIQPPKSTEIKLIHVAFQMDTHFQSHKLTEFFSSIQLFDDWTCNLSQIQLKVKREVV